MQRVLLSTACFLILLTTAPGGQQPAPDAAMQKLADEFAQAWARGDAKAIAALHTPDAIRIAPDATISVGRTAIEEAMSNALTGPYKDTTLKITTGKAGASSATMRVQSGTWEVTGGTTPPGVATKGTYINTVVREGDQWLITAASAVGSPAGS